MLQAMKRLLICQASFEMLVELALVRALPHRVNRSVEDLLSHESPCEDEAYVHAVPPHERPVQSLERHRDFLLLSFQSTDASRRPRPGVLSSTYDNKNCRFGAVTVRRRTANESRTRNGNGSSDVVFHDHRDPGTEVFDSSRVFSRTHSQRSAQ